MAGAGRTDEVKEKRGKGDGKKKMPPLPERVHI